MESFIGWVGGKRALRHEIIKRFPSDYKRYVEVFGGAGWVLFAKNCRGGAELEVYNDIDSNLVNLFKCVKYHPDELIRELQYTLPSHAVFYDYKEQVNVRGLTDIQRAARYYYLIKLSFGNKKTSYATSRKRLDKTLERFEEINERLKGVVVENRDFESLIDVYDKPDTLFYLDPPYHTTESYYKNNAETFSKSDHYRLCDMLKRIKGRFILSYNDDEFVRELYKNFNVKGVSRRSTLSSVSNSKEFAELIICNY